MLTKHRRRGGRAHGREEGWRGGLPRRPLQNCPCGRGFKIRVGVGQAEWEEESEVAQVHRELGAG